MSFLALPGPTQMYLALYMVTLLVHVGLMAYVLGGCALLLGRALVGLGSRQARPLQLAEVLVRDWLPFFLGAAITAGIGPLLFVQILYKEGFYTANLLLMHRFMAILPVLIGGFYLLYLLKTAWSQRLPPVGRVVATAAAFFCFVFVAWSWTENHLLSLRDQATWATFYSAGEFFYHDAAIGPRLGIWLGGVLPIMAAIVATQIVLLPRGPAQDPAAPGALARSHGLGDNRGRELRRLAGWAWAGLAVAGFCALGYPVSGPTAAVLAVDQGRMCLGLVVLGVVVQGATWWRVRQSAALGRSLLSVLWGGVLTTMVGVTLLRESVRLASTDLTTLYPQHARAAQVDGLWAFAVFALVNGVLIAWCFVLVARRREETTAKAE